MGADGFACEHFNSVGSRYYGHGRALPHVFKGRALCKYGWEWYATKLFPTLFHGAKQCLQALFQGWLGLQKTVHGHSCLGDEKFTIDRNEGYELIVMFSAFFNKFGRHQNEYLYPNRWKMEML